MPSIPRNAKNERNEAINKARALHEKVEAWTNEYNDAIKEAREPIDAMVEEHGDGEDVAGLEERLRPLVDAYNAATKEAHEKLARELSTANDEATKVQESINCVGNLIEDYCNERSERWQESDTGQSMSDLASDYQNYEIEPYDIESIILREIRAEDVGSVDGIEFCDEADMPEVLYERIENDLPEEID
jgi:predicted  nucleic acid-binding Zn-ribbon protein